MPLGAAAGALNPFAEYIEEAVEAIQDIKSQ